MKHFPLSRSDPTGSPGTFDMDSLGNPLDIGAWRGIVLMVNFSAIVGAYSVTLQAKDPSIGDSWGSVAVYGTIEAVGTYVLQVHPELTPATPPAVNCTSAAIPDRWRVVVAATGGETPSATYTMAARMLP